MSPKYSSLQTRAQRPRFSWDARNVPWTDGVGDQVEYSEAFLARGSFHHIPSEKNGNQIEKKNRDIVLMSNLFRQAKDVCHAVHGEVLPSDEGAQLVVDAVY